MVGRCVCGEGEGGVMRGVCVGVYICMVGDVDLFCVVGYVCGGRGVCVVGGGGL